MSQPPPSYFDQSLGSFVPRGDQQAFKIAFYNAAAIVFLATVSALLLAVSNLLQAFFRPIIWAVLCGTVLFPFKKTVADGTESWLAALKSSNTPFLLGLSLIPIRIIDRSSTFMWKLFSSKEVVIFVAGYAFIVALVYQGASTVLYDFLSAVYAVFDGFVQIGSSKWVLVFTLAYLLAFVGYLYSEGEDLKKKPTRFLSVPIWIVVLCVVANFFGFFRVLVFAISATVVLLIVLRVISASDSIGVAKIDEEDVNRTKFDKKPEKSEFQEISTNSSNKYIKIVFGGCCLVWVTSSPVVLSVFIFVLIYAILKKSGQYFGVWSFISESAVSVGKYFAQKPSAIVDIVIPSSIRKFLKLIYYGDQHIIDSLISSAGVLSSILVMIGLLLALVLMSIFFVFQVRNEVTHLVHLTGNLVDHTINSNSQYANWFTNASNFGAYGSKNLDSMLDDAFTYGRAWLGGQARLLAKPDQPDKADQLEAQVKMLVDRIYEVYLAKSAVTLQPASNTKDPGHHGAMDLWNHVKLTTDVSLLYNELITLVKENVGMLLSILDTVWGVLSANLQFVFSLLAALFSIVLGLGLEVLNFVIGILVFFTMLYYLLAFSKNEWKPIEWLKMLTPAQSPSNRPDATPFSTALEQAVSSVFILSFKMSTFYGLYAYFIHTLFALNVVFIPSTLAALLAAIPFLAPYWVFVPGALELYLVRGQTLAALLFIISSLAPMMFVDAAFYEEVKGSHPYVTGLAIVGGIYWLGLEGALIGPMLLCCMLVTLKMYKTFMPK